MDINNAEQRDCPKCGSTKGRCPECGDKYPLGTISRCPSCAEVNAPIDCAGCGLVVSDDLRGVLDFDMNLLPWPDRRWMRPEYMEPTAKRIAKRIVAGAMKRMLEDISVEMGYGGEINDEVMAEGQRRMDAGQPQDPPPPTMTREE